MATLRNVFLGMSQITHYGAGLPNRDKSGVYKHIPVGNVDRGMVSPQCRRQHVREEIVKRMPHLELSDQTRHYPDILIPMLTDTSDKFGGVALTESEANVVMQYFRTLLQKKTRETKNGRSNATYKHWPDSMRLVAAACRKIKENGGQQWSDISTPSSTIVIENILADLGLEKQDKNDDDDDDKKDPELEATRNRILKELPGRMEAAKIGYDQGNELKALVIAIRDNVPQEQPEQAEKIEKPNQKPQAGGKRGAKKTVETSGLDEIRDNFKKALLAETSKIKGKKMLRLSDWCVPPFDVALFGNMPNENLHRQVTPAMNNTAAISVNPLAPVTVFNTIVDTKRPESNMVPDQSYMYDAVMYSFDMLDSNQLFQNMEREATVAEVEALIASFIESLPGAKRGTSAINSPPILVSIVLSEYNQLCCERAFVEAINTQTDDVSRIATERLYGFMQKNQEQWEPLDTFVYSVDPVPEKLKARTYRNTRKFARAVAERYVELRCSVTKK
jgi:hypothetical protein